MYVCKNSRNNSTVYIYIYNLSCTLFNLDVFNFKNRMLNCLKNVNRKIFSN